jgi:predicted enzyme related to lactoylglutathione lyase
MDASVRFYTEVLGMHLTNRFGNAWATIRAGVGLTIGLHPASSKYPKPGTKGGIMLGLEIDEPIEKVLSRLAQHGVKVDGGVQTETAGKFAHFEDVDGNELYLWETVSSGLTDRQSEGAEVTA